MVLRLLSYIILAACMATPVYASGFGSRTGGTGSGDSEWTDIGTAIHPTDVSGTEDSVIIGNNTEATANIILGADGSAVFNQQGDDVDFRVEGNSREKLIMADASTDRVGVGVTAVPRTTFHVHADSPAIRISDNDSTSIDNISAFMEFYHSENTTRAGYMGFNTISDDEIRIANLTTSGDIRFLTNNTENMILNPSGQLQVPTTGSSAGILLGGDVGFYRSAANAVSVFSGDSLEFGDATSLEIPNSGGATTTTNGQISIDNDSGGYFVFHAASGSRILHPARTFDIGIMDPLAGEEYTLGHFRIARGVRFVETVLVGSSSPSVTWTLRFSTDRSAAGTEVEVGGHTTTNTTTGDTRTSANFDNSTISNDNFFWLEITAVSGTVDEFYLSLQFIVDK